jgi:hypothetical protein
MNLPKVVMPATFGPAAARSISGLSCVSAPTVRCSRSVGRLRVRRQPERPEFLDGDEGRLLLSRAQPGIADRRVLHTERAVRGGRRQRERGRWDNQRLTRVLARGRLASPRDAIADLDREDAHATLVRASGGQAAANDGRQTAPQLRRPRRPAPEVCDRLLTSGSSCGLPTGSPSRSETRRHDRRGEKQ